MSRLLSQLEGAERRDECLKHDAELVASMFPLRAGRELHAFTINIGRRGSPRISFGAMASSSAAAIEQHLCLAEVGERVEAIPVRSEAFPLKAARHQLEEARLREVDVDALRAGGWL